MSRFGKVLFGLILLVGFSSVVFAQSSTGGISITVSDPMGAVVVGATVAVKGSTTGNILRTLQTNEAGLATAPLLPPGTYDVSISAAGFKQFTRAQIPVSVGQIADLRIQLLTGSSQQSVTVTGAAPLIQASTSTVAQVVSSHQMLQLPLSGRSYLSIANLSAGAAPTVGGKDNSFNSYGNTGMQNAFLLDGARNVNYIRGIDNGQRDMIRPPLDALSEFTVQTSNYSAVYGASAGAVVNAVTKSGTNELHGSAYDFLQNDKTNASNFFALTGVKPLLVQNQFGGSLGGPIKKDRAWIFGAYEGLHDHSDASAVSFVPSLANRAGNFGTTPIYDPFTTTPSGTGYVRTPFPNNIIPTAKMSPITSQLLANYPAPNVPGSVNQFSNSLPTIFHSENLVVRGDVQLTSKDSMFGRYSLDWQSTLASAALPLPTQTPVDRTIKSYGVGYGYTHVFNATTVNEVRLNWTSLNLHSDATQKLDPIIPGALAPGIDSSIPQFNISGFAQIGAQASCCTNSPLQKTSGVWDFSDNLSKTMGRHSLQMGDEVMLIRPSTDSALSGRGSFGFTGVFTQNPQSRTGTGSAVADFLLGTATTATIGTPANANDRGWYTGAYFQDDWTVNGSLTLNLGVRYDYIAPYTETHNRIANLILDRYDPLYGDFILAGDSRKPRSLVTTSKKNLAPRLGFAYRVPKVKNFAVRGAFGIFYAQDSGLGVSHRMDANPPFFGYGATAIVSDQENPSTGFEVVPGATVPTVPPINPADFKLLPTATANLTSWADHMTTPYVQEWNLALEKQLPWRMVWTTTYVGNVGVHHWNVTLPNQPLVPGPGSPTARRPLAAFTVARVQRVSPWGKSNYNGLSTKVQKNFQSGVSFLAAYTYGRAIDYQDYGNGDECVVASGCGGGGDNPQNNYDLEAQRGPSDNNIKQRFSLGGDWQLPFGSDRAYWGSGWKSKIAGGWALAAIYQVETGVPFTPVLSFDNANVQTTSRPNRVCKGNLSRSEASPSHWFDTSCFVVPAQYTYGNSGRNALYGPGLNMLDLGLHRDFNMSIVSKPVVLQFRVEAFNALNHPQFAQPGSQVGTSSFGVVTTTSQNNRNFQFAARLAF
ncbi:MAG: carboxypeptidase regulatory-like domain-containing protein [Acidobacteriaceae bacterium]